MSLMKATPGICYPWTVSFIFWRQRRKYGAEFESARLWSCAPNVYLALAQLYRAVDCHRSPIELRTMPLPS